MADLDDNRPYTVVVGVSATSKSQAALTWAQHEVERCGGRLIAVRAWRMPTPPASPAGAPAVDVPQPGDVEAHARQTLEDDVAGVLGDDHTAEIRLVRGGKMKTLVRAAAEADLLVVDAPRQLHAGPMFAHRLVYSATCPVVIMPPVVTGEQSTVARVAKSVAGGLVPLGGSAEYPAYRPPMRF